MVANRLPEQSTKTRAIRVAFQGSEGAYSHIAARGYFSDDNVTITGYRGFRRMLEAVERDEAEYAVLPLENSTAGSVNEAYDLLAQMNLSLVGELVQPVNHCLIGLPGAKLSNIRRVYSHPQALAQCRTYIEKMPDCLAVPHLDTASAVSEIQRVHDSSFAAIASEEAAQLRGALILSKHINDQTANYTRMVIVAARDGDAPRSAIGPANKASLTWVTRHEPGALLRCLQILDTHQTNLTKLESRPIIGKPWVYRFYVDVEIPEDADVAKILTALRGHTEALSHLGSYRKAIRPSDDDL